MKNTTGHQRLTAWMLAVALVAGALITMPAMADDGVAAGSLQLRPGLRLSGGVNSSPLYLDQSRDPTPSGLLRVNPYLGISTPEPRAVELYSDLGAAWEQYFASDASSQSGLDLDALLGIRVNPNGVVSITPQDHITWTNTPNRNASADPHRILQNEFDLILGLHPGGANRGERLGLSGELAFEHRLWDYADFESYDRNGVGGRLELQWNFLPKTAFFIGAAAERITWNQRTSVSSTTAGQTTVDNVDSTNVRATGGFTGLLAPRFSLLLSGGYGLGNYESGQDAGTYLAHVQGTVHLADTNALRFGWEHNFEDVTLSNFVTYHRLYAEASANVGALGLGLSAFVRLNDYSTATTDGVESDIYNGDRKDTIVGGQLEVSYRATSWLTMGLNYRPAIRDSTATFSSGSGSNVSVDYIQHRAGFFLDFSPARPLPLASVSGGTGGVTR